MVAFLYQERFAGNRWMPHVPCMGVEGKEVIQNHTHAEFIFPGCFSFLFCFLSVDLFTVSDYSTK